MRTRHELLHGCWAALLDSLSGLSWLQLEIGPLIELHDTNPLLSRHVVRMAHSYISFPTFKRGGEVKPI